MSYLKTLTVEEAPEIIGPIHENLKSMFGMIPHVFNSMNLRPDLLEAILLFSKRLMLEEHALSRTIKELLAAYVSKLNSCEYWIDVHRAMVMAQGYTKEQVKQILNDVNSSELISKSDKALLKIAEKITREPYKVMENDINGLRENGLSDSAIMEGLQVIAFFNYLDRMADATGAPIENLTEMMVSQGWTELNGVRYELQKQQQIISGMELQRPWDCAE